MHQLNWLTRVPLPPHRTSPPPTPRPRKTSGPRWQRRSKASARRTARANALFDVHTVGCERVVAKSHALAKNGQRAAEASAARAAEAAASDRALVLLRLEP